MISQGDRSDQIWPRASGYLRRRERGQVYDLVDHVTNAAGIAGWAARYVAGYRRSEGCILLQREKMLPPVPQQLVTRWRK